MIPQVAIVPLLDKMQVLDSLEKFPEKVSADTLIEHILFLQSVANGLEQAASGKTMPHDQAMTEIRSWRR